MKTPLQAQPVPRPRGRSLTGQGEEGRTTAARSAHRPTRAGIAARRAPSPAAGRSDQGKFKDEVLRQGCARRPQAVPEGDEREGANLEQPDSGEAGGAPDHDETESDAIEPLLRLTAIPAIVKVMQMDRSRFVALLRAVAASHQGKPKPAGTGKPDANAPPRNYKWLDESAWQVLDKAELELGALGYKVVVFSTLIDEEVCVGLRVASDENTATLAALQAMGDTEGLGIWHSPKTFDTPPLPTSETIETWSGTQPKDFSAWRPQPRASAPAKRERRGP